MNSLISIIMPFKNEALFLEDTLQSILKQSYQNWELIAVDDSSTDNSYEIIIKYSKLDKRIKVLKNKKEGIIEALKTGRKEAVGEYITRMDADDLMLDNKLKDLYETLFNTLKKSVAIGKVSYFKSNGENIGEGYLKYQNWINNLAKKQDSFKEIYKECPIPSPSWMMRISIFDEIDGFNSTVYPEDYDLAFRMYKANLAICSTSKIVHRWRDYATRTSRTHENYKDNRFLELKVNYFLSLDYNQNKKLILQGAGKKGKFIAKQLIKKGVSFNWICGTPSKIGHNIYGVILEDSNVNLANTQVIVAIASPTILNKIKNTEVTSNQYYYFC